MRELDETTRAAIRERIPNYGSLTQVRAAEEATKVIAKDFYIYCERNLMIKDKYGQMVPLDLNWAQKKLVEAVLLDVAMGVPVRYIILKARQMGLSTVIEALCFWWTTTHKNVNSVIIAHKKKAANNLYKMFRRYYDNCHPYFRPTRKYNTKTDLTFDVEDNVKDKYFKEGKQPPGLGSEIQTLVAKDGEGRSDTILFFHGSEVAFWEAGADVLSAALQAVPLLPNTFAFLESTANGVGGYFYNEWQFAKKGESAFKPFFFAWHEHPEYELAPKGKIEFYDEEETELLGIFEKQGYPRGQWDRKIMWRREKKKEFHAEPEKFYQEYPKDDMEAFLASGRPVFDIRQLIKMEEYALAQPPARYATLSRQVLKEGQPAVVAPDWVRQIFQNQDPTPLKIWETPFRGDANKHLEPARYTIAVDVAEGIDRDVSDDKKEGDYSVIDVMRVDTGKTVARWRGHIDPDLLAEEAMLLGEYYNFALIGCEVNNHGLTTIQAMRNKFYRNLYMRETSEDEQFQERTSKMGWATNRKTKPLMINELAKAIREGDILDLDITFIRECMTYVRDDNGYFAAQEGMFDDCVIAKAINLQMAQWSSYDSVREKIHKPITRETKDASSNTNNRRSHTSRFRRQRVRR